MKRLLLLFASPTLVMGLTSLWFQVFPAQGPPPMGAYYMSGGVWTPVPSTGTFVPSPPVFGSAGPPPIGLYCYNSGLAEWVAADSSCLGGGGGGSGTVITFSAGALSPIFTTSVATATTTPALSFTLSNVGANLFLAGPTTGSAAAPTYRALVNADFPGTLAPTFSGANLTSLPAAAAGSLTGSTLAAGVTASSLTSLGGGTVGTAAFVNTGTSGATVPLLNVANNTFSGLLIATNGVQVGSQTGFGTTGTGALRMGNTQLMSWSSTAAYTGTADTIVAKASPGVIEINSGTTAGSTGSILAATYQAGILYSAAGTALPSCVTGLKGATAVVTDATSPTYLGTYTSGGAVVSAVLCNGTNWVTH